MPKFIIQPHGRLNDWVADEKGYFRDEGLDYELNVNGGRAKSPSVAVANAAVAVPDIMASAFERLCRRPS